VADLTAGRRSAEGHEFFVEKHIAEVSKTISAMLSGTFAESSSGEIRFPEITTPVLEKVIQYMHYKRRYENSDKQFPVSGATRAGSHARRSQVPGAAAF